MRSFRAVAIVGTAAMAAAGLIPATAASAQSDSPANTGRATTVATEMVPLIVKIGKTTFDQVPQSDFLGSPLFQDARYTTGVGQEADASQRAEFYHLPDGKTISRRYHVRLGQPTVMPPVTPSPCRRRWATS